MPATTTSSDPSCQFVPAMKNMRHAASEPAQAKPAKSRVGFGLRSAMAPMKMSTIAETIVVKVTVKNHRLARRDGDAEHREVRRAVGAVGEPGAGRLLRDGREVRAEQHGGGRGDVGGVGPVVPVPGALLLGLWTRGVDDDGRHGRTVPHGGAPRRRVGR